MRLTKIQSEQINRDLQLSPNAFGYFQSQWTGNCLARHLTDRYQLVYGTRHCRRLILQARRQATAVGSSAVQQIETVSIKPETRPWSGFSDLYRQEKTLQRLRQLSTANLPLKPFAASLFELLTAATNSGEAAQALMAGDVRGQRWLLRDAETVEWTLTHMVEHERANSDDPNITGMLISLPQMASVMTPLLVPERFMSPTFHNSPSYNEVWKHHRVYLGVMSILRDNGQLIGFAPIWKSRREKPFTQGDLQFIHKALPLITHGLHVGQVLAQHPLSATETESTGSPMGVITADLKGRIIAIDAAARALFVQPALFDGRPLDAFTNTNLRLGLQYVSAQIRQTFGDLKGGGLAVPAASVWWHGTGCVLLLKAVLSQRPSGAPLVTILVEERELVSTKQQRLAVKYGLSPRESQIFHLAKAETPRKEIARQLGLSANTVKTYLKQVAIKGLTIGPETPSEQGFNVSMEPAFG